MSYRGASSRSRIVVGLLLGSVALDGLAFLAEAMLLRREAPDELALGPAEIFAACVSLLQLLVLVAVVVAWCFWIHRTYANLAPLGYRHQRYTPGWAVGWYFMPLLNLIRPYQVMREIWNASRPGVEHDESAGMLEMQMNATPGPVAAWWAAWLIANFAGVIAGAFSLGFIVSDALDAVAALFAVFVVRSVTRMQDERAARITAALSLIPEARQARKSAAAAARPRHPCGLR